MKKTIVKELTIITLLALVIILTLRMVIYDFIPSEKSLPEAIKYNTETAVAEILREIKLNNINEHDESLLKTYMIEKSDLKDYISKNKKTDPFTDYKERKSTNKR